MAIQCTICISNLSVNEAANAANCGHVFHEPCLVQWFRQSKTCPQCRAKCDERQVRRLYFSAELNNSTVDVDSIQLDLDDARLQVRNLKTELDEKRKEIVKLRDRQVTNKSTIVGLEARLDLEKIQLRNANSQIASHKIDAERLRAVEKELNEKLQEANKLEYIKSIIDMSSVDVEEILQPQPDLKTLATLVVINKKELKKATKNRDEARNNLRVCQLDNGKLKKHIKLLNEKINTLESDNYKLQDDLSQMKCRNERNTSSNEAAISMSSSSIQSAQPATRSIQLSSTNSRIESPYLNIRQSNVGLTPLLHRKRKPETEALVGPYSNLTIFNNPRKLSKTVTIKQSSSQIYNGYGGSERKENFVGFPSGKSRINAAGRD